MDNRQLKQFLEGKKSRILDEINKAEVKLKEGTNTSTGLISIQELTKILDRWL
jgi:hypothetical protein